MRRRADIACATGRRVLTLTGAVLTAVLVATTTTAGAIHLPFPHPSTTTSTPTTTTPPEPSTTTTLPDTTTTSRPTTTTSRPTTTTTRPTTTATGARQEPEVSAGTASKPAARTRAATPKKRSDRRIVAAPLPAPPPGPPAPPAEPGPPGDDSPLATGADPPDILRASNTVASRSTRDGFPTMPGAMLLAVAMVLGVGIAAIAGRRRARSPEALARRIEGGALIVTRNRPEAETRAGLLRALRDGPVNVVGTDCRTLHVLVKVAAREGLEVSDPGGFVRRASRRLVDAKDLVPDRSRLPLRWAVVVERPTVDVSAGSVMSRTGAGDDGRLLSFAPGTAVLLWNGDCLN